MPSAAASTAIAALKGIAITASLLAAGQLAAISTILPTLYPAAQTSHRLAAQQFASLYRLVRASAGRINVLTAVICTGLAYVGYHDERRGLGLIWKLWATAGLATAVQIPWTQFLMEPPSAKLLWVSEVAVTASMTQRRSSGIGVRITAASPERYGNASFRGGEGAAAAAAAAAGRARPMMSRSATLPIPMERWSRRDEVDPITPIEEFEPFEDAFIDEREYVQLKVVDLLQQYNGYNIVRTFMPLTAGVLGLCAALME